MKKKLIVSGCSWADPFQCSEDPRVSNDIVKGYKKWFEIIANKLDMELINYGKRAAGNLYIFSSLIDNICGMSEYERSNIGLVIAAWSEAKRTDFEYKQNDYDYYVKNIFRDKDPKRYNKDYAWDSILYTDPLRGDMFYRAKQSVRYMFALQEYLKSNNIPYKFVQSLPLGKLSVTGSDYNLGMIFGSSQRSLHSAKEAQDIYYKQLKEELNNFQLYNLIDKKHYIGCMYDQLDQQKDFVSDLTTKTEYRNDDHPNQSGHDKIAHIILNNINNSR